MQPNNPNPAKTLMHKAFLKARLLFLMRPWAKGILRDTL